MNSAGNVPRNNARKTQRDQRPRRLRLKFEIRRAFIGEIGMPKRRARFTELGIWSAVDDLNVSDIAAFKINARIDNSIHQIAN